MNIFTGNISFLLFLSLNITATISIIIDITVSIVHSTIQNPSIFLTTPSTIVNYKGEHNSPNEINKIPK